MVRPFLLLTAALAGLAAALPAQSGGLKSVIDDGLAELARRQRPDGSYEGSIETTASSVLAFADSPRRYAESDGPFVRRAQAWLAHQVGPDGRPSGGADLHEQAALARWLEAALRRSRSVESEAAVERLRRFLSSGEVAGLGDAKVPEAEFRRAWTLPGATVEEVRPAIDRITSTLASDRGTAPAEFDRWLETLPAVVADLAARFPDLALPMTSGEQLHWASVFAMLVMRSTQAPAGFEEAPARRLAAALRALATCLEHEPKAPGAAGGAPARPGGTLRTVGDDLEADYRKAASAALDYLSLQQQSGRFGFMGREDPGITALALSAVVRTSRRLGRPQPDWVGAGLDWLTGLQKPNGSIHAGGLAVYVTSAAAMALADAGRPQDRAAIERAALFLKVVQRDEGEGYDPGLDWGYGGIGYGNELRPDLSNTQFGLEGLRAAGVPSSDPAMQRAILFLQRCQNDPEANSREIERADGRIVRAGTDGGAGYHPGESKAGLVDLGDGTFATRSYGSMTYALLKCYLFAGVPLEDPRVKAALRWIEAHWTVDLNPGFDPATSEGAEYQGLFYYYFTMAKALSASGIEVLTTLDGVQHRWREELLRKLLQISFEEGFWTNQKSSRWLEEFPVLATSYALVAMDLVLDRPGGAR